MSLLSGLTESQLREQLTQHNPICRLAPLAQERIPILQVHGDADVMEMRMSVYLWTQTALN